MSDAASIDTAGGAEVQGHETRAAADAPASVPSSVHASVPASELAPVLEARDARRFWRSLEEHAGEESFETFVRRAYPSQQHKLDDPPERREFLKLMGASLALAGLGSCTRQPREKILPYARSPEALVPGQPLYYATAMPWPGGALGLLVESHMGRPTKIEGNPDHPASLGATDLFAQAAVLGLYDPDRSRTIMHRGRVATWDQFLTELAKELAALEGRAGEGLAVLSESLTSPTLAAQKAELAARLPKSSWHQWEPLHRDAAREGALLAFGLDLVAHPNFEAADVVLSLEADFLGPGPDKVRSIRDFTARRKVREGKTALNRLYVVESALSNTGASADHRLAVPARAVESCARALAGALGIAEVESGSESVDEAWIAAVARDLERARGRSLVVAGEGQPPAVHAIVHALNARLGNVGRTVELLPPAALDPVSHVESIADLVARMAAGSVTTLVVLGGNPVHTAPADLAFAAALARVPLRVHLALHEDETSSLCDWHVNETHFLESWSDCRAADLSVSLVQPLIAPLYGGKSAHELVSALLGQGGQSGYDRVRERWRAELGEADFEARWRRALHDGIVAGTRASSATPALRDLRAALSSAPRVAAEPRGIEVVFRPDPTVWDGRFANNAWLQELPKPLSKLVWSNAAHLSVATAGRLGVENGDVIAIECAGRKLEAPVWITPGQADESVTLELGYGRARAGLVGNGRGYDAYLLRTSSAQHFAGGASVARTGRTRRLVSTQGHDSMQGRDIVRVATLEASREEPGAHAEEDTSLFPVTPVRQGHAWAMSIDLNACTACSACVVACQAENNVPVVGEDEVARGREMHWLRIDRYYEGSPQRPMVLFQPMLCQHCETAPCEYVCPVEATTHSPEGLNEMTYNRCIGTRYCSNNCPYKVRRFNFFLYSDWKSETLALQRNPDVTVRSRGVMEKCTYCVQRINQAKIEAKREDRPVRDGDVQTACQQVCPAGAIVFGDLLDPESRVFRLKREKHDYAVLGELNTRPRTTYLARVRNPNPELEGLAAEREPR